LLVKAKDDEKRLEKYFPNRQLPPFPVGTEVALVRRALLIASPNTATATALTESVQLRIYREVPEMTAQTVIAAVDHGTAANKRAQSWQSFHEFQLSRSRLFAGRAGGLRAVGPDELDFDTGFTLVLHDEFENREPDPRGRSFSERSQGLTKKNCVACHSLPGVYSFNSYFDYRDHLQDRDTSARPFSLSEMPVSTVAGAAVKWKAGRPSWTALRKLLAE